jgi:uncharacterized tellurite resistance protein B-like protein
VSDLDEKSLVLALKLHLVDRVVGADLLESSGEHASLARCFPPGTLQEAGLVDSAGVRTERYQRALAQALVELPRRLGHEAKLDLLHTVVRIAVADRAFRLGEGEVVLWAARLLGLSDDEFDAFMASYPEATGMRASILDS